MQELIVYPVAEQQHAQHDNENDRQFLKQHKRQDGQ